LDNTCDEDAMVHALASHVLAMTGSRTGCGRRARATVQTHDKAGQCEIRAVYEVTSSGKGPQWQAESVVAVAATADG
jgi:hypothetical protein